MKVTTEDNSVQFILDGDLFFLKLHKLLSALLLSDPAPETRYLRMAYWQFSPDAILPPLAHGQPEIRLIDRLAQLALKGHKVQLIAWRGTKIVNTFNAEMKSNWRLNTWVQKFNAANTTTLNFRNIEIYLEAYGKTLNIGTSNHQKMTVVSGGDWRVALVGGENVAKKYLSAEQHSPTNWWHDTAVMAKGAVTEVIDSEFVRRWNKAQLHNEAMPQEIDGDFPDGIADEEEVFQANVSVLTTNIESTPIENHIRSQVMMRINETTSEGSIYMENYALTDPGIVYSLSRKIEQHPDLDVVLLVNHPQNKIMEGFESFSYLMYFTYVSLHSSIVNNIDVWKTWPDYYRNITTNLDRTLMTHIDVVGPTMDLSKLAKFNPATDYKFKFTDINGVKNQYGFPYIAGLNANRNLMYSPVWSQKTAPKEWPYPHSKLAIFSDRYTFIGTSNWTYRSMQYDGEISLEIDSPDFAAAVKQKLFAHWNQDPNQSLWAASAINNKNDLNNDAVPLGELRIVPLSYGDFINPTSKEWKSWAAYGGWLISAYF